MFYLLRRADESGIEHGAGINVLDQLLSVIDQAQHGGTWWSVRIGSHLLGELLQALNLLLSALLMLLKRLLQLLGTRSFDELRIRLNGFLFGRINLLQSV